MTNLEVSEISKVFKNCSLSSEVIIEKFFKGEITKEQAAEFIRINNEVRIELDNNAGWFDENSAKVYKIRNINSLFSEYLLKTRKGEIVYKYFGKKHPYCNSSLMYGYRIATDNDLELFKDIDEHVENIHYDEKER